MTKRRQEESGEGNAAMAAHFGKYGGLAGKLALVLHIGGDPCGREVSEKTLVKALAWLQYLEPHARRVYHAVEHPETGVAELLLARARRGELPSTFTARDIYRRGWHGLSESAGVKRALRLLFDYGWLIEIQSNGQTGGRPADTVYALSPMAGGAS